MTLSISCQPESALTPDRRVTPLGTSGAGIAETRILGLSAGITRAIALARRLSTADLPIILAGPTGTGKELFAAEIHRWSGAKGAFVDVNCAALPREMTESLLFGHRRGAFTGAVEHAAGLLEEANGGTLFLDEMLCMPPEAQAKILRAIELGEVRRVGETGKRRVQFRVIGAIQDDMMHGQTTRHLRADLLQRVAGIVIELPALASRDNDVVILASHFASRLSRCVGRGTAEVLLGYSWPGNVRELRLAVDRACALSDESVISARALSDSIALGASLFAGRTQAPRVPLVPPASSAREHLLAAFAAHDWNAGRTARALGLGRTTLFKQLKTLGISLRDERSSLEGRTNRWLQGEAGAAEARSAFQEY
jgi:DNA-binding NtrC family response regulator